MVNMMTVSSMKKCLLVLVVSALSGLSSTAHAYLAVSNTDLQNAVYDAARSVGEGVSGPNDLLVTAAPTYNDLVTMTGSAGSSGYLEGSLIGTGTVFYDILGGGGPAGGDNLILTGFNDNDEDWSIGVWYDSGAGTVQSAAVALPSNGLGAPSPGANFSFFIPAAATAYGWFVVNPTMSGDIFHVSVAAVPEPASVISWIMMLGAGLGIAAYRRRKA